MAEPTKHVFLTGNVQIGKSTLIKALLDDHRDLKIGGFFTRWVNKQNAFSAGLYLFPAEWKTIDAVWFPDRYSETENHSSSEKLFSDANRIASFDSGNYKKKIIYKRVFDEIGRQYLHKARHADLVVMDEIGLFEDKAYQFQEEVIRFLDGEIPIIGVVRNKSGRLTNLVKNHPNVEVIELTRENRDQIKETLLARFRNGFSLN